VQLSLRQSAVIGGVVMFLNQAVVFAAEPTVSSTDPKVFQAKVEYCKTCHGPMGQGYRGATPMPRLAGQQPEYIQNQLKAFTERRRENRFMYNVAHVLSPDMLQTLAKYFNGLNPKPLGGGPQDLVSEGKKIFEEGLPKSEIPPCAGCHGSDAKGNGPFPRLAGQLHDYISNNLANWSKDRGQDPKNPDNSAIMAPIAHNLTKAQVSAVAAYLSRLE
jgi:cytochrome c553